MRKKRKIAILLAVLLGIQLVIPGCGKKEDAPVTSEISEEVLSSGYESEIVESSESVVESAVEEPEQNTKPSSFTTEYSIEGQRDGYCIVSKLEGTLYGLLDSRGKEVLALEYDKITFPESENAQTVIVEQEGKYGLYDYDGKEILPLEYEKIENSGSKSTRYLVQKDGRQSIVGLDGTVEKELSGIYNLLVGNSFLLKRGQSAMPLPSAFDSAYSLDEKEIFTGELEVGYSLSDVNDIIGTYHLNGTSLQAKDAQVELIDSKGNIIATQTVEPACRFEALGNENIFVIHQELSRSDRLFIRSTQSISEDQYEQIEKVDEETILAKSEGGVIDVFNMDGKLEKRIGIGLGADSVKLYRGVIIVKTGNTYRLYDKEGNKLTDERYLSVDGAATHAGINPSAFLVVQNLDGEYGIIDGTGEMRIPFGGLDGEKSYGGRKWEAVYVSGDTMCIVTETRDGNMVSIF